MAEPTGAKTEKSGARTYLDPVTGKRLRSVTTIKSIIAKKFLPVWAAKEAGIRAVDNIDEIKAKLEAATTKKQREDVRKWISRASDDKRDAASVRGTAVHDYAEARLLGNPVSIREDLEPYVKGYEAFIKDHSPEFTFTEMAFINPQYGYAGSADWGGRLFGTFGEVIIGDWKTGNTGPWGDWAYQLTAYAYATHTLREQCPTCKVLRPDPCSCASGVVLVRGEMPEVSKNLSAVVRLLPDRYELHWVGKTDITMPILWEGFKSAIILDKIDQAMGQFDKNVFKRG